MGFCKEFINKDHGYSIVHDDLYLKCFLTNLVVEKVMQLVLLLSEKEVDQGDCPDVVNDGIGTSTKLDENISTATHEQAAVVLSAAAA